MTFHIKRRVRTNADYWQWVNLEIVGGKVFSGVHWPNGWYYEANLHGRISKLDSVGQLSLIFVSKCYWIPGTPFVYLFCHCFSITVKFCSYHRDPVAGKILKYLLPCPLRKRLLTPAIRNHCVACEQFIRIFFTAVIFCSLLFWRGVTW